MRKLQWGVLGTGRIVAKAGTAIQQSRNGHWLGVAGRNEETGRRAADTYGVERAYPNYQALIDDPQIEAVYIALLNHVHAEWTIKALEAGKHVLLEKPFTMNAKEAETVREAALRSGAQVMEAHVWRWHEPYREIKAMLDAGAIGEPVMFDGHFSFAADDSSTRLVKEWGGGALYDIGCYPIAWSRHYFGSDPEAVDAAMTFTADGVDVRFAGTLHYPGGRLAQVSAALDAAGGAYYDIIGTRGKMRVTNESDAKTGVITAVCGGETKRWTFDRVEPYRLQAEGFADAILSGTPVPYDAADGCLHMRIIDALFASARTGSRVRVHGVD